MKPAACLRPAFAAALLAMALTWILGAGPARAAQDPALDQANQAYTEGHYDQAVAAYDRLLATRGYSAPILFDLGNAYFRLHQIGPSILNYERARVLSPADPDVAANLRFVRQAAALPAPQQAWYKRAAHTLSLNQWSWLGSAGLCLLCGALLLRGVAGRARPLLGAVAVCGALLLGSAGTAALIERPVLERAVVMAPDAPALLSPFASARPLFSLQEGDVVQVQQVHGGYARIAAGDGRVGWMSLSHLGQVIPS